MAKAIAGLRRPGLAALAANLLARERRQEAEQFLALGESLWEVLRTLGAEQLRTASRQQHQIEQTLHGVLADPEVATRWSKGRLVKVPEAAVGFAVVTPQTVPARPVSAEPRQRK
ncbi:hypothetical protein [Streptomyces exfoliatus]|uniref:hypothetical protein n=1 Tax=Streptomyces exfoliatus TaxID=1905 RepID=UPI00068B19FE|nr:hypothetical protein [Streptomyces exfoliatus]